MSIKNDVFKWSKKIVEKQGLEIEPEELASMALYNIYNQPYFQDKNAFLKLHKNLFDEISLGVYGLNKVVDTSSMTNHLNVQFFNSRSKDYQDNYVVKDKILKTEQEMKDLSVLLAILKQSDLFTDLIKNIEDYESTNDTLFLSKIIISLNENTYEDGSLLGTLDYFIDYKEKNTEKEFDLEFKTKKDLHRKSRVSRIDDRLFTYYNIKELMKGNKSISDIDGNSLEQLTGLKHMKLSDLDNFKKKHPEMYEKSLYRIFIENKDPEQRMIYMYEKNFFQDDKKELIKKIHNELEKESVDYLLSQYKKELDLILKETIKKYPEIGYENIHEGKKDIVFKEYENSSEYYVMKDNYIKDSKLEIFQQESGIERHFEVIKGLNIYGKKYFYKNKFAVMKNDLEEFAVIESFEKDSFTREYNSLNMKSLYICNLQDIGRGVNQEDLVKLYSELIKTIKKDTFIVSYDLYDRRNLKENNFDIINYNIIQRLKTEFPDLIFYNDGMKIDKDNYAMAEIKKDMLIHADEAGLNREELIKLDKKIEEFIKSDKLNDIENLSYGKERDAAIEKLYKEFIKAIEVKNKNKVKI
jgi:hypothetical protein